MSLRSVERRAFLEDPRRFSARLAERLSREIAEEEEIETARRQQRELDEAIRDGDAKL